MKDGGPAFPKQGFRRYPDGKTYEVEVDANPGMSIRDWFAGMAMQGLLASMAHPQSIGSDLASYPQLPSQAFEIADAMLKEREK